MPNLASPPRLARSVLTFAVAASTLLSAALLTTAALAQGTAEQEEACTPDAVKLCSATIPDIPKTTACMKAHFAQLTPRCQAAFNDATAPASKPHVAAREARPATRDERARRTSREERRREAALPPRGPEPAPREVQPSEGPDLSLGSPDLGSPDLGGPNLGGPGLGTPDLGSPSTSVPGLAGYRAQIAHLCRQGLIDPFTCHNTLQALSLSE